MAAKKNSKNEKRVTIKDVARAAGVTHPTVSRVIHDDKRVSDETKKRVNKVIRQLGYRPNLIARGLVNSKTKTIGLIVPELNPHVNPLVKGVTEVCRLHDYAVMLFSTDYWQGETASFVHIVDNWRVDGMLIYNVVYNEQYRKEIRQARSTPTPFVFIDKYLNQKGVNAVGVDNMQGIRVVLEYLAELGHTQIGLMDGNLRSVDGHERHDAFVRGIEELGLTYHKQYCGVANYSDEQAYDEMKRILTYKRRPTAMVCCNDLMAMGVIKAAAEAGIKVPSQLSVTGFDDIPENRFFKPALTTVRPPHQDAAAQAAELLIKLIDNPSAKPTQTALPAQLIIRKSTAKASAKKCR